MEPALILLHNLLRGEESGTRGGEGGRGKCVKRRELRQQEKSGKGRGFDINESMIIPFILLQTTSHSLALIENYTEHNGFSFYGVQYYII